MKVCPLCEFIYEDDQSLCDMDGTDLVYDPAPLALAVAPESAPLASTRWRRFAATALVGVVLGTLVLVFHVIKLRTAEQISTTASQKTNHSSNQVTGDYAVPPKLDLSLPVPVTPAIDALPAPIASPQSPSPQSTHLPGPGVKATTNVSPFVNPSQAPSGSAAPKLAKNTRRPWRQNAKPIQSNHKTSSIGSFLKKTGRILKKPFRF